MRIMKYLGPLLILCFSLTAYAQPFKMNDRHPYERIEQLKKVRMIEIMDLKEEQSVRFFSRLNEHENAKRELIKQRSDLLDKVERLVRNNADEKEFEKLFLEVRAVNSRITEEDQRFFSGLGDILSAVQQGKFLLFERQFERELREAMKDIQLRRRRIERQ